MAAAWNVNDPQFYMPFDTIPDQMHIRQKLCFYVNRHQSKDPSYNSSQYKKLYHQPKCKISVCFFCLKQLLIEKQKLQEQAKGLSLWTKFIPTLRLPCGCKVNDKEIYQFLAIKCKDCSKLLTALSSAMLCQGGYIHAKCHRLSVYNNKISTHVASSRNKPSSVRSASFATHAIEVQSCNLLGKLQVVINQPTIQLNPFDQSQRQKPQINQKAYRQHADQQFYPVELWKSSLNIDNDLYIQCHYCKYPLPRDKLYQVHIILKVQPNNDHLFCIRCMLYVSGKLKTTSQLKQALKQQLKTKKQLTMKKPIEINVNPRGFGTVKPQQFKLPIGKSLTRAHANPLQSLLCRRQKMNIISQKSSLEFNRKQMLKKLSPFDLDYH